MKESKQIPEAVLIRKAIHRDKHAFGELYQRYLTPIYRYFYFQVNDVHEAEDLTEQTFLNAWEHLNKNNGRPVKKFRSWLFSIAHNLLIDFRRKHRPEAAIDSVNTKHSDPNPLEKQVHQQENEQVLIKALDKLEHKQKQVIICRMLSSLSHAETADVLGLKHGHVRVLQHRALSTLRGSIPKEEIV